MKRVYTTSRLWYDERMTDTIAYLVLAFLFVVVIPAVFAVGTRRGRARR